MGCCSSKATTTRGYEDETYGVVHGGASRQPAGHEVRQPTNSEKRRKAAEAAESRQADWRQGGAADPEKAKELRLRREKDELLGRIYNRYNVLGKEAPIGLPSCDVDQLKRHLETLK
ncbi:hypothetical protein Poli38472_008296 [Pythium oligandrum]|uniref:Uncharacterized protein n=1 Tax=Pythium oligandrum TaxID=41045 RepID=A0A8K1FLW1_PYTOL|nr:hypothetical protein Poli38472_008296 [Pythium oligandrum]|eukprot:TMW65654.1 hypothetical protein Poli38472_008296 [Pythium oligandrum]